MIKKKSKTYIETTKHEKKSSYICHDKQKSIGTIESERWGIIEIYLNNVHFCYGFSLQLSKTIFLPKSIVRHVDGIRNVDSTVLKDYGLKKANMTDFS